MIPTDSQADAACCHAAVMMLSTAVMCFDAIFRKIAVHRTIRRRCVTVNAAPTRRPLHQFKTTVGIAPPVVRVR
jgi:hypothetical protein